MYIVAETKRVNRAVKGKEVERNVKRTKNRPEDMPVWSGGRGHIKETREN